MRPMGGSVRLKRPMRLMGGSVRLKRPMRRMGGFGSVRPSFQAIVSRRADSRKGTEDPENLDEGHG
jgi:hypothetical protein